MSFWSNVWLWIRFQVNAILHSGFPCFFWIRPTWGIDKIPDQEGKVADLSIGS